eukprot:scaffold32950_cov66-Attheya_sp.AAC.2
MVELTLTFAIFEAIKAHVDGFGTSLFYCVVGNSGGTAVVDLNGYGRLGVPHLDENDSDHDVFFGIAKAGAQFGFSGRGERPTFIMEHHNV